MHSFPVLVLGFAVCFLSPFPVSLPQLFHRCLLLLSLPHFPQTFRFLSSASLLIPATQPSVFPFRSSRFRLTAAFPVLPTLLSLPWLSPSVPPGFPCFPFGFRTWLSACFLSSFPASLPQPFHWCLPFAFAFGLFPSFCFLSSASFRVFDYSASALSFPCFPLSPRSGSSGADLSPSVSPVSMRPFRFWYLAFCSSFLLLTFRLAEGYLARLGLPFGFGLFPLVNTLGSGYSAWVMYPEN